MFLNIIYIFLVNGFSLHTEPNPPKKPDNNNSNQFVCKICQKTFVVKKYYEQHKLIHKVDKIDVENKQSTTTSVRLFYTIYIYLVFLNLLLLNQKPAATAIQFQIKSEPIDDLSFESNNELSSSSMPFEFQQSSSNEGKVISLNITSYLDN